MSIQFEKICRACMAESMALIPIWPVDESDGVSASPSKRQDSSVTSSIAMMLNAFTVHTVSVNDKLPEHICLSCVSEMNQAFSFKQKCERSESALRAYAKHIRIDQRDDAIIVSNAKIFADYSVATSSMVQNEEIELKFVGPEIEITGQDHDASASKVATYLIQEDDIDGRNSANHHIIFQCLNCLSDFSTNEDIEQHLLQEHHTVFCKMCEMYYSSNDQESHEKTHQHTVSAAHHFDRSLIGSSIVDETIEIDATVTVDQMGDDYEQLDESENETSERTHEESTINQQRATTQMIVQFGNEAQMDIPKFFCAHCKAAFATQRSLKLHFNSKKCLQVSYQCDICNKVFIKKRYLAKHLSRMHLSKQPAKTIEQTPLRGFESKDETLASRKYKCNLCEKTFTMTSSLKDHLRVHSGERPFLCSICGKGFSQKTNLTQHVMRHNQNKPFKCNSCPSSFVSRGELNAHTRTHTGAHPFVCDMCSSGFTTSSSLVKHRRIHTGERPYACEHCPLRFTALGTLKNHRRTHTGERPFRCTVCNKSFGQRSDCMLHIRTHNVAQNI